MPFRNAWEQDLIGHPAVNTVLLEPAVVACQQTYQQSFPHDQDVIPTQELRLPPGDTSERVPKCLPGIAEGLLTVQTTGHQFVVLPGRLRLKRRPHHSCRQLVDRRQCEQKWHCRGKKRPGDFLGWCACNDAKRNEKPRKSSKGKAGNYQVESQYERGA